MMDIDDLEPVTPRQRELLLAMGLERRLARYVMGDSRAIAEAVVSHLLDDLDAIGFVVIVAWDRAAPAEPGDA